MADARRSRRETKAPAKPESITSPIPMPGGGLVGPACAQETEPGGAGEESARRCGFIALIGAPNVGKSTLVNALVGSKVAIVSHKVQTTRSLLRGIATAGSAQLIFVDTPGIFAPRRRLDRAMVTSAWAGAADADVVGMMVEASRGIDAETGGVLDKLAAIRRPRILLINKIDLVDKTRLLEIARHGNDRMEFAATFMVSALTGNGVADVKNWLAEHVPEGPWHYPPDQITDAPLRQLAAEITREKLYLRLHQELPYQSMVETEQWQKLRDGSIRIEQTIYVERDSQRKIVLGKGGRSIKAIGADARREIADMIEAPVHLFLLVKVRERWSEDRDHYRAMGLEYPRE